MGTPYTVGSEINTPPVRQAPKRALLQSGLSAGVHTPKRGITACDALARTGSNKINASPPVVRDWFLQRPFTSSCDSTDHRHRRIPANDAACYAGRQLKLHKTGGCATPWRWGHINLARPPREPSEDALLYHDSGWRCAASVHPAPLLQALCVYRHQEERSVGFTPYRKPHLAASVRQLAVRLLVTLPLLSQSDPAHHIRIAGMRYENTKRPGLRVGHH